MHASSATNSIGIHGGGMMQAGCLIDSTAGCIALLDADIRRLWKIVELGTRVHIHPKHTGHQLTLARHLSKGVTP